MSDLQLKLRIIEAQGLQRGDKTSSDPFVIAKFKGLGKTASTQTSVVHNTLNPVWNQDLVLYPKSASDVLLLKVYDHDTLTKDNLLGMVEIPLERFFQQGLQDNWLQLMKRKGGWKSLIGGHPTWFSVPGALHFQLFFNLANTSAVNTGLSTQQYVSTGSATVSGSKDIPVLQYTTGFNPVQAPLSTIGNQPYVQQGLNNSQGFNQQQQQQGFNQPFIQPTTQI